MISAKFVNAYQEEYEKERLADGRHLWADTDAYFAECSWVFENYCAGKPLEEQIRSWLALLKAPNPLGFKMAFVSGDMALLHDALYQSAVITHAMSNGESGCDHCLNLWDALATLAAGLSERFPLLLPETLGKCANGHPGAVSMANLMMALWYKKPDFEADGRKRAAKALAMKQPAIDHAAIRYLLALLDGDAAEAGAQLNLYCKSVSRVKEFGVTRLGKMFWPTAHGLYNLAFAVWDKEQASRIPLPEPECFCADLARWQAERDFQPGKLFLEYPAPLGLINRILACTPPEYTLHQPYLNTSDHDKNKYYTDGARFKSEFVARILKECERAGFIPDDGPRGKGGITEVLSGWWKRATGGNKS